MSSRKETPDVLGEILNSPAKPSQSAPSAVNPSLTPKPTQTTSARQGEQQIKATGSDRSDGVTTLGIYGDHLSRIPGLATSLCQRRRIDEWKEEPEIVDYLNSLGQEGWEMIGIVNGRRNTRDAYFRRVDDLTAS